MYLKVSPLKGIRRFQVRGKLAPRYVGPFQIVGRRGEVAYQLDLPSSLSAMHDVFHMSQLKKCLRIPTEVVDVAPQELQPDLTYCERPIRILDIAERKTWHHSIKFVKVQ